MLKTIFIVSSGRSGSTSIAEALNRISSVQAFHGPRRFEKLNCLKYLGQKKDFEGIIKSKREDLIKGAHEKQHHYIESSWFLSALIENIVHVFPKAIFVHLVRDARNFIRSGMNRPWFENNPKFMKSSSSWTRDRWNPPEQYKTRLEKIAWLWVEQQKIIEKQYRDLNPQNQGGVIRFEDIICSPINNLVSLWGIKPPEKELFLPKKNVSKKTTFPVWEEWSRQQLEIVHSITSEKMQGFGYDADIKNWLRR